MVIQAWEFGTSISILVLELGWETLSSSTYWLKQKTATETGWGWQLMLEQGAWAGRQRRARSNQQLCVHQNLLPSSVQKAKESWAPTIFLLSVIFMKVLADLPLLMVSTSDWLCWVRPSNPISCPLQQQIPREEYKKRLTKWKSMHYQLLHFFHIEEVSPVDTKFSSSCWFTAKLK